MSIPATRDARSLRRGARERAFAKLVSARLFFAPVLSALALAFAFVEPTTWRRAVLVTVVVMLMTISIAEAVRYRRQGLRAFMVPFNLVVMAVGQIGIVAASGGLFSPLVPVVAITSVLAAVLVERPTLIALVGGVQVPAVWALAAVHASSAPVATLVPSILGEPGALEDGMAPWLAATIYTAMLVGGARVGTELRSIFEVLFDEARQERDRSLALHAEQSRALTTLSGEIAHELKNPLTSIKGLAVMIAKDVDGKTGERLSVLRREVDRMQTVLEEFLNFSRPLVPLSTSEIDLVQLARDVVRLHEGSAGHHGVSLHVESEEPVWASCDARKVRQIVINLVQNALEASAAGADVRVAVERGEGVVRVRVLDEGPGLDAAVAARVFEAGVTTKEHGSGLGLAVARSLARQHGGELALSDLDIGCEATLTLPRRPPDEEAS